MSAFRPQETVADFKERIAIIRREIETGKKFSVIGGPRAHECVVRPRQTPPPRRSR
jgi:hypothetical protein